MGKMPGINFTWFYIITGAILLAFYLFGGDNTSFHKEVSYSQLTEYISKGYISELVVYDNNDASTTMHSTEDYCTLLIENETDGNFGTPFKWTYQGERGTNIQLKCKIIK